MPPAWAPSLVLGLSLLATVLATYSVALITRARDESRFRSSVRWTTDAIEQRLDIYMSILRGGAAFLAAHPNPTAAEFKAYVNRLKLRQRYPGIQGIGLAHRVLPTEAAAFTQTMRQETFPDFEIHPAGPREEYFPIAYIEPLDRRNREAIGYDMFSEPTRREAMARARDVGQMAASSRVTLVQEIDPQKQPGFLIYAPVYRGGSIPPTVPQRREQCLGFVYSPFRVADLFEGIFPAQEQPNLHFDVYDGTAAAAKNFMYQSPLPPAARPKLSAVKPLEVAGHSWTLSFQSTPEFQAASSRPLVLWVLGIGLLFSFMLYAIAAALARAQQQLQAAQAELKSRAQNLEQTVAERTARLRETVAELEHMSYSITHDMRAPLRAIQSFGGLIEEEAGSSLSPTARNYLGRMKTASSRMDALIRDVLDYGKLVRNEVPLHPVDADALLRGMLETYPSFQTLRTEVEIASPLPKILGNEAALTQCFSNLLGNALKFVTPGVQPHIRIWAEELTNPGNGAGAPAPASAPARSERFVRIYFADNGIGIPEALQGKIFGLFQRLSQSYEGTGVGLAIVRKAAERMGGRVGLRSTPGQGSCFWLDLRPASAAE